MLNKFIKKFINQKGRLLSFAGCVCIIKFIILALLLFYLSFFKAPKGTCKVLTKIQRILFWD